MIALRSLERFARKARVAKAGPRCELCASPISQAHRHVVDLDDRRLLCTCVACSLLFASGGSVIGRYRAVPNSIRSDPNWRMSASDLETLGVPVGLAFFFRPSRIGRWMAVFPSPAGATEAELDEEAWSRVAKDNALLRGIEDDVEALLVQRRRDGRCTSLIAPIDACYGLTAVLRRTWQGIDGGDEARTAVDSFIADLVARSTTP